MWNEQKQRLVLRTLLFLYVAARLLQLFAGRIPALAIVALHVLPPALFALIHGARIYGSQAMVFLTLSLGVGSLSESLSLRTGIPFGHYRFTDLMGPKSFDLSILLALAYVGMGYLS